MSWKLTTSVFQGPTSTWEELTSIISGLSLRSSVHGGLQTIEFDIADNYIDAYRWAYDHIGCKVYVFDNAVSPPVAEGVIFEPAISQDGNRITAYGPWQAYMFSRVFNNTADFITTGQTGYQIRLMLLASCPGVSSDRSNVDDTGTDNFPWQPTDNAYPGNLIPGLAALSDASNREWYFWLQSAPLTSYVPKSPIPWFKPAPGVPGLYTCWRKDMAPGGLNLTPSLRELANDVRVLYRDAGGTRRQTVSAQDVDSIARYGLRERWNLDLGLAAMPAAYQYRDMLLTRYKEPQQSANFTLNTWLYDQYGGKWPLWRAIADFPFKFTVNDLVPSAATFGFPLDNKQTFITLACEYDYDRNTLTITPDTEDNRADALLARHQAFQ